MIFLNCSYAQNDGPAVGQWRSVFSYYQGTGLATDGTTMYAATESGFFTYNSDDNLITPYSKATGMSDIGLMGVAHDIVSGYTILGYQNSNIDLFKDGSFQNIPDLYLSGVVGDKTIYDITAGGGYGYLSTGIGLIILSLDKREVKGTVQFFDGSLLGKVNASAVKGDKLYAATTVGLFRSDAGNTQIQNYQTWDNLSNKVYRYVIASGNNVYVLDSNEVSLLQDNGNTTELYANSGIVRIDPGADGSVWVSTVNQPGNAGNKGYLINASGTIADSFQGAVSPKQICQADDGSVWFMDDYANPKWGGLRKVVTAGYSESYTPAGPVVNSCFDVWAKNGELWMAHGGINRNWTYLQNYTDFSHYQNGTWKNYTDDVAHATNNGGGYHDFIRILKDESTGKVYAAAFVGGLFELLPDGTLNHYRENYLEADPGDSGTYHLEGLALDDAGNLWMTNYHGSKELKVMTRDGQWYGYHVPANSTKTAADIVIDDGGDIWYVVPGGGVAVFNYNGTLDNTSDDVSKVLRMGEGAGNLPDNNATCIAKDKDGAIWVGTDNGIGIISCPELVLQNQCEGELRAVQYPGQATAGYLFMNQKVTAIAVDGANRKWIGTTNGVWLISDDAETLINNFTTDNSPLPSNEIVNINMDPVTGDVYISTAKGLVAYRGTATEGATENTDPLLIYPNPVPPGYNGSIAIRGIAANADVRITDISGQLVYRGIANGGELVWSGKDYTGHKVQSGVYMVFVVSKDGSQKATGKFIVNH